MAEALSSSDAADWRDAEPEIWEGILRHFDGWAETRQADAVAVEVQVPQEIRQRVQVQAKYPALNGQVRLTLPDLVGWLTLGLQNNVRRAVLREPEAGWVADGGAR